MDSSWPILCELKFMLGWVRTILPSRFQFKFEKRSPNWGPRNLHKERSVPTLTGEGINTHTSRQHLSISGISYWSDFHQTLKVESLDLVQKMPTVIVTFVQATYALVTFVHISNISAVTVLILTKLFGPIFFGVIIFCRPKCSWTNIFQDTKFC